MLMGVNRVADYFIYKSQYDSNINFTITPLKLQKLLYYSQAWTLALTGESLFEDDIQAWVHGPVIRSIYDKYKKYGYNQIRKEIKSESNFDSRINAILEFVWSSYGHMDAKELEKQTHSEEPWITTRGDLPPTVSSNKVIKHCLMESYYKNEYIDFEE